MGVLPKRSFWGEINRGIVQALADGVAVIELPMTYRLNGPGEPESTVTPPEPSTKEN